MYDLDLWHSTILKMHLCTKNEVRSQEIQKFKPKQDIEIHFFAPVTLTSTPWPLCTNLTQIYSGASSHNARCFMGKVGGKTRKTQKGVAILIYCYKNITNSFDYKMLQNSGTAICSICYLLLSCGHRSVLWVQWRWLHGARAPNIWAMVLMQYISPLSNSQVKSTPLM